MNIRKVIFEYGMVTITISGDVSVSKKSGIHAEALAGTRFFKGSITKDSDEKTKLGLVLGIAKLLYGESLFAYDEDKASSGEAFVMDCLFVAKLFYAIEDISKDVG